MPEYDATAVDATAGPGATAVLHGMLSTLTEVLDGLDRRLAAMEAAMEGARLEPLVERLTRLEERVDERLAEVIGGRERTAEALAGISHGVGHLAARLDQLAELDDEPEPTPEPAPVEVMVEAEPEPDRIGPLADAVARLEAAVADVAGRVDALPAPEPAPDLTPIGIALDGLARRIEGLPVPDPPPDLAPIGAALAALAGRIDVLPIPDPVPDLAPIRAALDDLASRIDALPAPDPAPDLTPVAAALDGLARRLDTLPAPERVDLTPVLERLGDLAVSADAISFGLAGLTDALRDGGDNDEEPDVVGAVAREAERIRATVGHLGQALTAVQAETAALAARPVEVKVDVDLDRIVALLEEHGAAVRDEVARLDTLLRGQVAEVAGRTGSITDVIGRLDGRLHEVVDGVRALQRRAGEPVRLTAVGGE